MRARLVVPALAALVLAPAAAAADGFMLVQAGAFWMGRDDGPPVEGPLHRVYVRDFWIGRTKVTNAEFATFLDAAGPVAPAGRRRYDWDDPDARIRWRPRAATASGWAAGAPPGRAGDGRWVVEAGFAAHPAVEVTWFGARDYCRWRGARLPTEAVRSLSLPARRRPRALGRRRLRRRPRGQPRRPGRGPEPHGATVL